MKAAVEDVAKTIIDASCPSATEPCIDKDYIMEKMSKTEVTRFNMNSYLQFLAISWVTFSPTAATVKTTYETIAKTMEASVSCLGMPCIFPCYHPNISGFEPLHNIKTDRIRLCPE